jgi:phosphomevalonate kinase
VFSIVAPGKLFIMGEYAVLDGAPAIVAAVDHGVRCNVTVGNEIVAPDTVFVGPALNAIEAPTLRYEFTSWRPIDLPHKIGLGSSAAATVAAIAAGDFARRGEIGDDPSLAALVHKKVQGSGSGLDVWASWMGGINLYRRPSSDSTRYTATATSAPPITVIHTGQVAKTGPRVERWLAWSQKERNNFSDAASECTAQFATDPVRSLSKYGTLLSDATVSAGVDYMTDNHKTIAGLATKFGGAAKPSGAGGGDIAIAIIPDPEQRKLFVEACHLAHFPLIPVSICNGVSVES